MGRVRVAGPLAAFADGFGAALERLEYSRFTAEAQLQLTAHVSCWLEDHRLAAQQLTGRGSWSTWSSPALTHIGRSRAVRRAMRSAPVAASARPVRLTEA
jgi:hypothetical protein